MYQLQWSLQTSEIQKMHHDGGVVVRNKTVHEPRSEKEAHDGSAGIREI
mgnify:FL=1